MRRWMKLASMDQKISHHHILLSVTLWLAGLLFALTPLPDYEAQSVLIAVLCVGFSTFLAVGGAQNLNVLGVLRSPIILVALGFWVWALVSVCASEVRFISFIYFCIFSLFPLSFFLAAFSFQPFYKVIGWIGGALMAVLAGFALVQYFALPSWLGFELVHWPFTNPNSFGAFLSLGVFGALGWMLSAGGRAQSNMAMVLAILCLLAMLTTGSRGAFLGMALSMAVLLFIGREQARQHWKCLLIVGVCALAGFFIFGMVGDMASVKAPLTLVAESFDPQISALTDRPAIWASTLEMVRDYPVFGTGIGTFFLYYPQYRGDDMSTAGLMAHSDPLQFASEMGVLGAVLFYAFVILALIKTVKVLRQQGLDPAFRVKVGASFCAMAAFVLHAHISFHFHVLPLLMVGGLAVGYWYVLVRSVEPSAAVREPQSNMVAKVMICIPLIGFLVVFGAFQKSEIMVSEAQSALERGDNDGFAELVNRAGKMSQNMNARALVVAADIPVGMMQFQVAFMESEERRSVFDQAMGLLDKAQAQNPRDPLVYFYRAELKSFVPLLVKELGLSSAEEDLREGLAINPQTMRSRILLADLLRRRGQKQEAMDVLAGGLQWPYHNQDPSFFYDKTERMAKELGAKDVLDRVAVMRRLYDLRGGQ
jgi:O-antigen ligase